MPRTTLGWPAALATAVLLGGAPGCAAAIMHHEGSETFAGTKVDLLVTCTVIGAPFGLLDLPFSFLLDLVFAIEDSARRSPSSQPAEPSSSSISHYSETPPAAPAPEPATPEGGRD